VAVLGSVGAASRWGRASAGLGPARPSSQAVLRRDWHRGRAFNLLVGPFAATHPTSEVVMFHPPNSLRSVGTNYAWHYRWMTDADIASHRGGWLVLAETHWGCAFQMKRCVRLRNF
jgi:hypothetical protein